MQKINKELAVIGTVGELLRQKAGIIMRSTRNAPAVSPLPQDATDDILLTFDVVMRHLQNVESRSGFAILSGFSVESFTQFMNCRKKCFGYDYVRSPLNKVMTYRFKTENFAAGQRPADMTEVQIDSIIKQLLEAFDPAINYPMDVLRCMGVLNALENKETPAEKPEHRIIHVCPNHCGESLIATALVAESWSVNSFGHYIATKELLGTAVKPNDDDAWTCSKCGSKADLYVCDVFRHPDEKDAVILIPVLPTNSPKTNAPDPNFVPECVFCSKPWFHAVESVHVILTEDNHTPVVRLGSKFHTLQEIRSQPGKI